MMGSPGQVTKFRRAYAEHRAAEGRGAGGTAELLALPYLRAGPHARSWSVRARTFEAFVARIVRPLARTVAPQPLHILDVGAGNGWLCHRMSRLGHGAVAVDLRDDDVDGLGVASGCHPAFHRVAASFDALALRPRAFDVVVFNASLHYATDLAWTLREAVRVLRPAGRIAVLDSPFYSRADDGEKMVAQKRATARDRFGDRAADLLGLGSIEYLTVDRLRTASAPLGLDWRRHRVRYPLWYEARPALAVLRGDRRPSRFDLWEACLT
jgi:SAM-dependent methyltransferase